MTLYDVNGNSTYIDKVKKQNTYFKNRLIANGTAYKWYYNGTSGTIEDTSHGMIDIGSAIDMFRHGLVFSGDDMEKFTDTLTEVMWNKSITSPTVTKYVDGTGDTTTYTRSLINWLELSQFDKNVWPIAAEQYRNYTPSKSTDFQVLSQIMKWDPVKLVNQGFELKSSFDSTQPARWVRWQSDSTTVYLDSTNRSTGDYGLTIKANGTSWQKLYQTWDGWIPSATYVVTFDGKTDGTGAGGEIVIRNETTGTVLASYNFINSTWQTMTFTFTAPSNATDTVRVYLGNKNYTVTGGKAHFDNVKIKKSDDSW